MNQKVDCTSQPGSSLSLICPSCDNRFSVIEIGGLSGYWRNGYDDLLILVLCGQCSEPMRGSTPESDCRIKLKAKLDTLFETHRAWDDEYKRSIAITTLKTLEYHGGDIARALELGWPFERPSDQYDVFVLPEGMVVVQQKEVGHDA